MRDKFKESCEIVYTGIYIFFIFGGCKTYEVYLKILRPKKYRKILEDERKERAKPLRRHWELSREHVKDESVCNQPGAPTLRQLEEYAKKTDKYPPDIHWCEMCGFYFLTFTEIEWLKKVEEKK